VNEGEIAVASNEELHAAPFSGKRLLALWNALPSVEKRKKVGDRDALIDHRAHLIETTARPFAPHPRHRRRALRSRTLITGLSPARTRASGVSSGTGGRRHNRPSRNRRAKVSDPRLGERTLSGGYSRLVSCAALWETAIARCPTERLPGS